MGGLRESLGRFSGEVRYALRECSADRHLDVLRKEGR
jgi:hypothetical protein